MYRCCVLRLEGASHPPCRRLLSPSSSVDHHALLPLPRRHFHASLTSRAPAPAPSSHSPSSASSPPSPSSHSPSSRYHSSPHRAYSPPTPSTRSTSPSLPSFSIPPYHPLSPPLPPSKSSTPSPLPSPSLSSFSTPRLWQKAEEELSRSPSPYPVPTPSPRRSSPPPLLPLASTFGAAMMTISKRRDQFDHNVKLTAGGRRPASFNEALNKMTQMIKDFNPRQGTYGAMAGGSIHVKTKKGGKTKRTRLGESGGQVRPQSVQWAPGPDGDSPSTQWAPMREAEVDSDRRQRVLVDFRQTVGRLAGQMRVRPADVLAKLAEVGHRSKRLTDFIDAQVADLLVTEFGMVPVRIGQGVVGEGEEQVPMERRGPVVCVMGHVDHGKTTLLDTLRRERRALYEAGNITQSIGAFRVDLSEGVKAVAGAAVPTTEGASAADLASIDRSATVATFLDTPGHAAFRAMRERGASSSCTDLIVLVVSAVDGVQPQTVEVIELSKQHSVPLLVAINKVDLEGADPRKVKEQLCMYDIVCEDMGGEVLAVEISAKLGTGIQQLKENILLVSDMLDLRAPVDGPAQAYVIEKRRERSQGCVMNVVVRQGRLKVGHFFVCGLQYGPVRALVDENGKRVEEATPSQGVQLLGASTLEDMTEELMTVETEDEALKHIAIRRKLVDSIEAENAENEKTTREEALAASSPDDKEEVYKIKAHRARFGRVAVKPLSDAEKNAEEAKDASSIALIVKADVAGGLEALLDYVYKLPNDEVTVSVVRSGVGEVNEADVTFAEQVGAMIVGFNVPVTATAAARAKAKGVPVLSRDIIYFVMDEIRDAASKKLPSELEMRVVGTAEVAALFPQKKKRQSDPQRVVAGLKVKNGELLHNAVVRVSRDGEQLFEGSMASLKVHNEAAQKVEKGGECGVMFQRWDEAEVGDLVECVRETRVQRLLDDSGARGFETVHNPKYDAGAAEREEYAKKKKKMAQELKGASTISYAPAAVRAKFNKAAAH